MNVTKQEPIQCTKENGEGSRPFSICITLFLYFLWEIQTTEGIEFNQNMKASLKKYYGKSAPEAPTLSRNKGFRKDSLGNP